MCIETGLIDVPFGCRPKKFLHAAQDETFKQGLHELHGMQSLADEVCRYDLDDFDSVWLRLYNELRVNCGNCKDIALKNRSFKTQPGQKSSSRI